MVIKRVTLWESNITTKYCYGYMRNLIFMNTSKKYGWTEKLRYKIDGYYNHIKQNSPFLFVSSFTIVVQLDSCIVCCHIFQTNQS